MTDLDRCSTVAEVVAERDAALTRFAAERVPGAVARLDASVDVLHILCPASATFDAAEALRLELVAAAPPGVAVDVEIAEGGDGSAEDEAGRRLFASERRERLAGRCPPLSDDGAEET